jgi:hypothetical protein
MAVALFEVAASPEGKPSSKPPPANLGADIDGRTSSLIVENTRS